MATYGFSAEFLETHRRRIRLTLPVLLVIVLAGSAAFVREQGGDLAVIVPIVGIALAIAMWRGFRRQAVVAQSFQLDVAPGRIVRTLEGFPALTLRREDLVRIEEHPGGELTIHASDPKQSLRIPAGIERRDELLRELEEWGPLEKGTAVRSMGWGPAMAVLVVVAFAVTINSTNRLLVVIVGSLLFATLITSAALLLRSGIPRLRILAVITVVPALAVLARVINMILG